MRRDPMAYPMRVDEDRLDHTPGSVLRVVLGSIAVTAAVYLFLILLFSAGPA